MVSLFLLLGCNLSCIVDLFAALHELASASARTLLKLASSARALLKPYGYTLSYFETLHPVLSRMLLARRVDNRNDFLETTGDEMAGTLLYMV